MRHERLHRRLLFAAIVTLGMLATAPVFTHHFAVGDVALLAILGTAGDVCRDALYRLLAPVHTLTHVLLFAGLAYAVVDRARAWLRLRRTLGHTEGQVPSRGDRIWTASHAAGVAPGSVAVVSALGVPAFTAGWLTPRIFVARELQEWLSADELTAVIAHEGAHARRRDPLRLSLLRFLACWFFWLPALRRLADDIADETEVAADEAAESVAADPLCLASAIVTLASWPGPMLGSMHGMAPFMARDVVERRVLRLAGESYTSRSRITWRAIVGAVAALALSWTAGAAVAQPSAGRVGPAGVQLAASVGAECMPQHAPRHWLHAFCPPVHHVHTPGSQRCPCK